MLLSPSVWEVCRECSFLEPTDAYADLLLRLAAVNHASEIFGDSNDNRSVLALGVRHITFYYVLLLGVGFVGLVIFPIMSVCKVAPARGLRERSMGNRRASARQMVSAKQSHECGDLFEHFTRDARNGGEFPACTCERCRICEQGMCLGEDDVEGCRK